MLSNQPLPDVPYNEALDTLVRLHCRYIDPTISHAALRPRIEGMTTPDDLRAFFLRIGQTLDHLKFTPAFAPPNIAKRKKDLAKGLMMLEKFFNTAHYIDDTLQRIGLHLADLEKGLSKTERDKIVLEADIRAFRQACGTPAYREISRPVLNILYGETGAQVASITEPFPGDDDDSPTPQ